MKALSVMIGLSYFGNKVHLMETVQMTDFWQGQILHEFGLYYFLKCAA